MIDDHEIWACANQLIKRHGDNAPGVAKERADELLADGKGDGYNTFTRIAACIQALMQTSTTDRLHRCRWEAVIV